MPFSALVKHLAYSLDPECWNSYSGKTPEFKREIEKRRNASLAGAMYSVVEASLEFDATPMEKTPMPPMKIVMLLHFHAIVGPFQPEAQRRSNSYVRFVKELLDAGMIERPSLHEREAHEGWAYRTTPKGVAMVEALCAVPMPVLKNEPEWIIPGFEPKRDEASTGRPAGVPAPATLSEGHQLFNGHPLSEITDSEVNRMPGEVARRMLRHVLAELRDLAEMKRRLGQIYRRLQLDHKTI